MKTSRPISTCLATILLVGALCGEALGERRARRRTDREPVFLECREKEMFLIPVEELRTAARAEMERIEEEAAGDTVETLRLLNEARLSMGGCEVDMQAMLVHQLAIKPTADAKGHPLGDVDQERTNVWYGALLARLDNDEHMLHFFVRDDSYTVFKRARGYAWGERFEVSYDLLDVNDVIKFGLGAGRPKISSVLSPHKDFGAMQFPFGSTDREPVFVDVYCDSLVLYPGEVIMPAADLENEGNAFERLLDDVEKRKETEYIVLLIRPRAAIVSRRLRKAIRARGIDVGYELFESYRETPPKLSRE